MFNISHKLKGSKMAETYITSAWSRSKETPDPFPGLNPMPPIPAVRVISLRERIKECLVSGMKTAVCSLPIVATVLIASLDKIQSFTSENPLLGCAASIGIGGLGGFAALYTGRAVLRNAPIDRIKSVAMGMVATTVITLLNAVNPVANGMPLSLLLGSGFTVIDRFFTQR